jgi:hypothetical protein
MKQYTESHKEQIDNYQIQYKEDNDEKIRLNDKLRYQMNKEQINKLTPCQKREAVITTKQNGGHGRYDRSYCSSAKAAANYDVYGRFIQ